MPLIQLYYSTSQLLQPNYPGTLHYFQVISVQMINFKNCLVFIIIIPGALLLSIDYEAFNLSCLNNTYITSNSQPIQLAVPPFSLISIMADLRHLSSNFDLSSVVLNLNITNQDSQISYTESIVLNVSTNSYSLYAANNILLSAFFTITDATLDMVLGKSYLLRNSVSALVTPPEPLDQVQKTFLFVITNQDFISLPYNVIKATNIDQFNGYFLTQEKQIADMSSRQRTAQSYNDYWSANDKIAMPYLPYFSNCENSGDYLYLSQMIHNASECQLYGYQSTPIHELLFGSSAIADTCRIVRNCIFDEIPGSQQYPVWSTLDTINNNLFYITATEQQPPFAPVIHSLQDPQSLVGCKLKLSEGDNTTGKFPLKTKITIGFYQQSEEERVILNCEVEFSLYSESTSNFEYALEVNFQPLNHTEILLDFGFKWYIYILVFIMVGIISNLQFIIFWFYHVLTTLKSQIHFRLCIFMTMIKQILKGVMFAVFIAISLTFVVEIIMNGTFFGTDVSSNFTAIWDYAVYNNVGYFKDTQLAKVRQGRMGFVYMLISLYLAYHLSPLLIGKERKSTDYEEYSILGQKFKPFEWNRGKFLFGMYLIALCSAGYLYFTYSSFFNANIWMIIVMMQIAQMVLQQVLNSLYDDVLPTIPMKLSVGVLAYLATMGAVDLYYFMLGYLVDVGISTIERVYLSLIQQKITKFVEEKNEELHRFYINLLNDEEEDHEKKSQDNNSGENDNEKIYIENQLNDIEFLEEEIHQEYHCVDIQTVHCDKADTIIKNLYLKAMAEKSEQREKKDQKKHGDFGKFEHNKELKREIENKKFELLTDSAASMVQYLLQPIIVFMMWITYNSSNILNNFQIAYQNCILYLLSSIILAICYQFNIIFVIHVLELYFNFDYKKLMEELLERFKTKNAFWITDCEHMEEKLEYLEDKSKACNRYCLSSQMFFVVSLYTFLIYLFIIGFTTIISSTFNIFSDPLLIPILIFWLLLLRAFQWLLKKIIYFFDIWDFASFAQGGNKINEDPEFVPSAEQQTQNALFHSSVDTSSIKFTFKQIAAETNQISDSSKREIKSIMEAKLKTVCKKLESTFERDDFRLQYAIKNKDFIRSNIEKILPLVNSFPENDSHWLGKNESVEESVLKKKKEAKSIDPGVSDFVSSWLKRVEANRAHRKEDGFEKERKLKKCNFCFKTWAIYYGYEGICLQCSKQVFAGAKQLKEE